MKKALSKKNLWEQTPLLIKSTLGRGLGLIPLKWLLGKSFRTNYKFVQEAQWWSLEQYKEYQLRKLREILKLAYERTKFYRRIFDNVGFNPGDFQSLDHMNKLPTIDKRRVVENLLDMCTKNIKDRNVDYQSTGGSSGTPLHFYINANRSSVEYAYLTTNWERVGYKLGMPMAVLRGRIVRPNRNGLRHEYDPIFRHHYYSNFHMSERNIKLYLEQICTIGSCMLHAYPSSAQTLAHFIAKTGIQPPKNIKGILLESESVYSDQVQDIEKAFGVKTFSSYGHSEKLVCAAQCEHTRNYHVWPTYGYIELLDNDSNPVTTPGQQGEIVGTGFINTVVPFIRYRTGDYATYVDERCAACGREHITITVIEGRWPQGGLIAKDGSVVTMTALNIHDDTFRNVGDYQYRQSTPGKATLCIIPMNYIDENEQQRILSRINKRLQGQIILDLQICTELVKTARGKQPRVVHKCALPR
jgi:phenylacetate-CoA ligase